MLTSNYFTYMNKMKNKIISHHQNSSKANRKSKQYHTIRTVLNPIEKQNNITPSEHSPKPIEKQNNITPSEQF